MRRHYFLARFFMIAALAAAVMVPQASAWAASETRVALVIGNSAYQNTEALRNPLNDATELDKVLTRLGFKVILGKDLTAQQMDDKREEFMQAAAGADIALFFYAGHGLQFGRANYLMPVDAKIASQRSAMRELVALDEILREMQQVAKASLVFLDACRNNPLAAKLSEGADRNAAGARGLAPVQTGDGNTLVVFATAPDKTADDGLGQHSPFTEALLRHIEVAGIDVEVMLKRVLRDVQSATNDAQQPERLSKLKTEFQFVPVTQEPNPVVLRPPNQTSKSEVEDWNMVRDSNDADLLAAYIDRHPGGVFSNAARKKLRELASKTGAVTTAVREDPDVECNEAHLAGTREAQKGFIEKFPTHPCADRFRRAIRIDADNTSYKRAEQAGTIAEYQKYLEAFPDGIHISVAKDKMAALQAIERGEAQALVRAPTPASPTAAGTPAPSRTYMIGSNTLGFANMRQGPGLGWPIVTQIPEATRGVRQTGSCVPSDDGTTRDTWCPVSWNGVNAYVSSTNLLDHQRAPAATPVRTRLYTIGTNTLGYANMRQGPGLGWPVITQIPEGTQGVRQTGDCVNSDDGTTRNLWCPVSWSGFKGHVSATNLQE